MLQFIHGVRVNFTYSHSDITKGNVVLYSQFFIFLTEKGNRTKERAKNIIDQYHQVKK